jgi:thiamine biosynthesis lipoprotein
MTTDALSTTIFILGAVDGLALIEDLEGFDAIIIDNHGKVHYSSGFEEPASSE